MPWCQCCGHCQQWPLESYEIAQFYFFQLYINLFSVLFCFNPHPSAPLFLQQCTILCLLGLLFVTTLLADPPQVLPLAYYLMMDVDMKILFGCLPIHSTRPWIPKMVYARWSMLLSYKDFHRLRATRRQRFPGDNDSQWDACAYWCHCKSAASFQCFHCVFSS